MKENKTVKDRLIAYIKYLGIGQGKFEIQCGLSNGYVNNIRKSITPEKLSIIAEHFPELNTGWLMTGEGAMLRSSHQEISGDNNTQFTGNNNNVNNSTTLDKAINEIAEQRKLVAKSQEQIDRLLGIIEKFR